MRPSALETGEQAGSGKDCKITTNSDPKFTSYSCYNLTLAVLEE